MKPIQNQTLLFVLSLICSLFAASISQNVDPKVKEICAAAKDPPLCEKSGSSNDGGEAVGPDTVLVSQMRYVKIAGLTAATIAVDMQKNATDAASKEAFETCCNEFLFATAKVTTIVENNITGDYETVRDEMGRVKPVFAKCVDPNFSQVINDFRAVLDNIESVASATLGPPTDFSGEN